MNTPVEEEVTTKDIMKFMTMFKESVDDTMKMTNDKLDARMDKVDREIVNIKEKIDRNEEGGKDANDKMDARLDDMNE